MAESRNGPGRDTLSSAGRQEQGAEQPLSVPDRGKVAEGQMAGHTLDGRDIVVIGASAGGVEALKLLVAQLPADLPASLFVVLHLPPEGRSVLPAILERSSALPASHPSDGTPFERGRIYVAPPDRHLEIEGSAVRLSSGPRENGYRPAIDRLFTTAAATQRERVTGVILSGALDDGTVGLNNVVSAGGAALIQDPEEALYPAMPSSAAAYVPDARILPLDEIGAAIWTLATKPVPLPARPKLVPSEEQAPNPTSPYDAQAGRISGITCPECNGVLWELDDDGILRFRCRVGHAYTLESLVASQGLALENALWTALRALDERVALSERLSRRFSVLGNAPTAERYRTQADESRGQAAVVRRALEELIPEEVASGNDER
ncbi:MAG TPA: chemotaxis protein CheB [Gaiella sp.]|nr:chemotaxis protein CheB [Gaiella sp.]